MRNILFAAVVVAACPLGASAQPTPSPAAASKPAGPYDACREAALAVDDGLRDLGEAGLAKIEGISDNSAPRATLRAAERTAIFTAIQANLTLMSALRCPAAPQLPISDDVYLSAAIDCSTARDAYISQKIKGDVAPGVEAADKEKCTKSNWKPGPAWAAARVPPR
jgi:hypothetical protein